MEDQTNLLRLLIVVGEEVFVDRNKVFVVGSVALVCEQIVLDLAEVGCLVILLNGTQVRIDLLSDLLSEGEILFDPG